MGTKNTRIRAAAAARQQPLAIDYGIWTATTAARRCGEGSPANARRIRVCNGPADGDAVQPSDTCFGTVTREDQTMRWPQSLMKPGVETLTAHRICDPGKKCIGNVSSAASKRLYAFEKNVRAMRVFRQKTKARARWRANDRTRCFASV
ncbi:hypothetical protein JR063_20955 [Xanthomonas sp. CFBP 8700]|nr:hypothetical protein [Xanthomonas bonasiae]